MRKIFKDLALGAAVAGLFAGAAMVPGCGGSDSSKPNTEGNGCSGPNGCNGMGTKGLEKDKDGKPVHDAGAAKGN